MGKTFQDLLNNGQAEVLGIVSPVPMGNWLATTQYQKLNLVRHNTATYIARTSNRNIEPGVADDWATYWMLICIDGGQVSPDGEYPEMSVGSVMHALLWGNKSYDGSSTQTITAADLGLADVYKPQGSIAFASLPATPNESNYGYVWNITNDFTTDSRFIEGAGKKYSAGTNVGVIEQDGVYYYDILGNFVDLSNYAKIDGNYQKMTVGQATNAQNAANVTSQINGKNISDIFESDGVTVKEAAQAQGAEYLSNEKSMNNNASIGWVNVGSITKADVTSQYSVFLLVNGTQHIQGGDKVEASGLLEFDFDGNNTASLTILFGNLNTAEYCVAITDTEVVLYHNMTATYNTAQFTVLAQKQYGATTANSRKFNFTNNTYGQSAPANAVYAVVRNNASEAETANSLTAVQIPNDADLNDYVGSEYWGKVFYATGEQAISNSPVPASYVFHLEVLRLSGDTVQVITAGSSSNNSLAPTRYFRYVSSNLSYGNWEEIVTSDGSYPTLGAGHLPNNYIYSGGTSDPKWYKIATISNAPNLAAASLLLSINGIFATQDNQYGAETGQIEFDAANAGGTYSCSATLNYGNINTNNVCVVQNGSTAELYYHFDSNYQAILVTAMSFYGGSTASYELTNVGVSARPSNAIYAVNRNVAAKVENALTIIKDGVSTVYDGSEVKTVEITENGGITVIEIPANDSGTLTSEQLQQVKNNPQNTVLRRTYSPEINEIYCFDSVNMTQGADSAYTFRNVTSMAQDSLTLQAITVGLNNGGWVYSSVQTSAGGGGSGGVNFKTVSVVARGQGRVSYYSYSNGSLIINTVQLTNGLDKDFVAVSGMPILISGNPGINIDNIYNADVIVLSAMVGSATNAILANATGSNPSFRIVAGTGGDN